MLDDGDGGRAGRVELGHQLEGGVRVVDIVVGEFLALHLPGGGDARAVGAVEIEGRALVRILAIAQRGGERAGEGAARRGDILHDAREPGGNGRVIGRRHAIGLARETAAELQIDLALALVHGGEEAVIVGRVGENADIGVVLGAGADHGRAANVDILDDRGLVGARGDGLREGVEVDHEKVDARNAVLVHGRLMGGVGAHAQKPAMDAGVQRLHAPVHDLGKAGDVGDVPHGQAGRLDRRAGAAGGDQLDAARGKAPRQIHEPGLVEDRKQRAAHGMAIGGGIEIGGDGHGRHSGSRGGGWRGAGEAPERSPPHRAQTPGEQRLGANSVLSPRGRRSISRCEPMKGCRDGGVGTRSFGRRTLAVPRDRPAPRRRSCASFCLGSRLLCRLASGEPVRPQRSDNGCFASAKRPTPMMSHPFRLSRAKMRARKPAGPPGCSIEAAWTLRTHSKRQSGRASNGGVERASPLLRQARLRETGVSRQVPRHEPPVGSLSLASGVRSILTRVGGGFRENARQRMRPMPDCIKCGVSRTPHRQGGPAGVETVACRRGQTKVRRG